MTPETRIAVVGGGMSAWRLCERLVQGPRAAGFPLSVFCEEDRPAYDRVHLTDVVLGRDPDELCYGGLEWYARSGVDLHLGDPVVKIDRDSRRLTTASGRCADYDRLVLATGSQPRVPLLPGISHPDVFVYRSVEDARRIVAAAERAAARGDRAAVLGGGLLGLEAARALQKLRLEVDVFEQAPQLLPRHLDADAARVLVEQIRGLGLGLHVSAHVRAVVASTERVVLELAGDRRLAYGMLVVAAGVHPRDELAREAGLECHEHGGVVVDDVLTTSDPRIHAIGECARHRGRLYGLASPGLAMADTLATHLLGGEARFEGVAPATRLKVDAIDVSVAGEVDLESPSVTRLTHRESGSHRALVLEEGRLVGATVIGEWAGWAGVQERISRRHRVRVSERRRFRRRGELAPGGAARPIRTWSDRTTVCTCTGVDCGALRMARARGCETADALAQATGASTVCGTCRPLLEAMTGEREETRRGAGGRGLLLGAALGAAALCAIAASTPVPFSRSVVDAPAALGFAVDTLWRDGEVRQVTGFTSLAIVLASLLLSLRKRFDLFARTSFTRWRSVHALLGAGSLVAVGVHTGLRLGANLDRAVMLSFLAVAALGVVAGVFTALEHRIEPGLAARLRRASTLAHIAVFAPFPLLVLFHVVKVYWY